MAECKCYMWTDSGNVPSAKLMGLDEAVFYFGFLPSGTKKLLCMKKQCFVASMKHWLSIMFEHMGICLKMSL